MNNLHWTFHVHSTIGAVYPVALLLYHNVHNSFVYQRYFVQRSKLHAEDEFLQMLEAQISNVSNARLRPIRNAKLAVVLEDSLESETVGSFGFNPGVMFKFSSRITLKDAEDLRKKFDNLNALIGYNDPFVDSSKFSDADLQKIILSENAKNFIINREIQQADSIGHVLVPAAISMAIFAVALPLLISLRKFVGSAISLSFILIVSTVASYLLIQSYRKSRILNYDKMSFQSDSKLLKGCEEYLLKSQEFGKLLRAVNGTDSKIGKKFDENGDCVSHLVNYSKRLAFLQDYIKVQAVEESREKQKEAKKKLKRIRKKVVATESQ